jgi:hypothetical protein
MKSLSQASMLVMSLVNGSWESEVGNRESVNRELGIGSFESEVSGSFESEVNVSFESEVVFPIPNSEFLIPVLGFESEVKGNFEVGVGESGVLIRELVNR